MSKKCAEDTHTRFPALTPAKGNLDAAQVVKYDYLVNITQKVYGNTIITKDPDGSLQGPFGQLLYTPTLVELWVNLQLAVAGNLPASENEAAVLGVLSVNKATYGIYAHTILAQKSGYTAPQVEAMLAGVTPFDITERQAAIHKLAIKMVQLKGPLDTVSFNDALSVLGQVGIEIAIHQTAAFMYAALMLNVGDVCLPSGV
ncbi:hypothetical protein B0J14DRAFT_495980 [Halenospora varia]|nr:hypothetical protein B0J14DRAFT_495980 [Halenospora varia]